MAQHSTSPLSTTEQSTTKHRSLVKHPSVIKRLGLASVAAACALTLPVLASPARAVPTAGAVAAPLAPGHRANPADPDSSADAKKAWLAAEEKAGALNELVLQAQEKQKAAKSKATAAAKTAADRKAVASAAAKESAAASTEADAAQAEYRVAADDEAGYRAKAQQFAAASFRGARLGSLSALLSSNSPDQFLETASQLNVVAGETQQVLDKAAEAKTVAAAAAQRAQAAQQKAKTVAAKASTALTNAQQAKRGADDALRKAVEASATVKQRQQDLKTEAARLKGLYNSLTEQERQQALAAQQAEAEAAVAAERQSLAARGRSLAPEGAAGAEAAAAPDTPSASAPASGKAKIAVEAALSKVGVPYVWGAAGPDAFDCSGLTSWAWAQAGVTIPRTSADQATLQEVPLSELQPGDLITYYSPVSHVALYIGNGQIVNASTSSKPVMVMSMYYNKNNPTGHRVVG
ncbi:C40 family peptidase [Nakamurella aerolata]|uniref:C40 family peptidase n=1 Tax=Nakamurella aerolata TaxID=1656892 RepID=A0A849A223_9ACTN|nr:C40 family peptidase [Nakamurella aerolata]NNG34659.1 C40 family peptidase [Nakamurella aerolata]